MPKQIDFYNITGNDPTGDDAAIGEGQLSVEVDSNSPWLKNGSTFTFNNSGPEPCSIADVYFDDGRPLILEFVEYNSQWSRSGFLSGCLALKPAGVGYCGSSLSDHGWVVGRF